MSGFEDIDELLNFGAAPSTTSSSLSVIDDLLADLDVSTNTTRSTKSEPKSDYQQSEQLMSVCGYASLPENTGSYYRVFGSADKQYIVNSSLIENLDEEISVEMVDGTDSMFIVPKKNRPLVRFYSEIDNSLQQLLLRVEDDAREFKESLRTKFVLWMPTAKIRPGSTVQGFAFIRDLSRMVDKMFLSSASGTLKIYDSDSTTKRVIEIPANKLVVPFSVPISEYDIDGSWKAQLEVNGEKIFENFDVEYFEKPDIEIISKVKPSYSLSEDNPSEKCTLILGICLDYQLQTWVVSL